jgi:general secretion pathway protein C
MLNLPADTDRLSRIAAISVGIAAAGLCAWIFVRLVWLFVPHAAVDAPVTPLANTASTQTAATSIAQWHLFGNPQSVDLAARARNAPNTSLDLVLRGTFALTDPKQGIAIIVDGPRGERSYNVGDRIGGDTTAGATLAEVYADHVVLSRDGAQESLSLPRPEEHAAPAAPGVAARAPGQSTSVPPGYVPSATPNGSASVATNGAAPALARASAADIDGGRIAGARLSGSGAAGALMSQVGLRPTDVVTAVNGTPLANVANPQQLIEQFGNASSLQVTIQRDGHPATLTLNLR